MEKCKVTHIGRSDANYSHYMEGMAVQCTAEEKDLGLYVAWDTFTSCWEGHHNFDLRGSGHISYLLSVHDSSHYNIKNTQTI